jgi:hypothetical protein
MACNSLQEIGLEGFVKVNIMGEYEDTVVEYISLEETK